MTFTLLSDDDVFILLGGGGDVEEDRSSEPEAAPGPGVAAVSRGGSSFGVWATAGGPGVLGTALGGGPGPCEAGKTGLGCCAVCGAATAAGGFTVTAPLTTPLTLTLLFTEASGNEGPEGFVKAFSALQCFSRALSFRCPPDTRFATVGPWGCFPLFSPLTSDPFCSPGFTISCLASEVFVPGLVLLIFILRPLSTVAECSTAILALPAA